MLDASRSNLNLEVKKEHCSNQAAKIAEQLHALRPVLRCRSTPAGDAGRSPS